MSDNLCRYRAIRDALRQWYPAGLDGHQARHLITLAMLMSGIVGSQHTQLDNITAQVPTGAKPASRTKRFCTLGRQRGDLGSGNFGHGRQAGDVNSLRICYNIGCTIQ